MTGGRTAPRPRTTVTVRGVLTTLGLVFASSLAVRGLWWTEMPRVPLLMLGGIALFVAVLLVLVLVDDGPGLRMPRGASVLGLVAAGAIPTTTGLALDSAIRTAPFATWYIGGLGLLAVVAIVRRRPLYGWVMLLLLAGGAAFWLGPMAALQLGLVGSIMWVASAHLLVVLWDRAVEDAQRLTAIQENASAGRAAEAERQRERRLRVQYALRVAGPVLTRAIVTHGALDESDRLAARLAEGRLRDELRGAALMDEAVRQAVEDTRRRGAVVTVTDDGGLEGVPEPRRREIRAELARILAASTSSRVIVRSVPDPAVAVTVVGRDACSSDEDAVDLWEEIPRDSG